MSDALLRAAFETRLKAWADAQLPVLPIAFENVSFTPPTTTYLRAFIIPARTVSLTLDRLHRQRKGIFQVSVVLPTGAGAAAGAAIVTALDALFPPQTPMVQGAIKVVVIQPMSAAAAIQEPDRYVIPVTATYQVDEI